MAVKRKKAATKTKTDQAYQLKVTLLGSEPPIWRRLLVPTDAALGDLNFMLQAAMGWTNSHLHQFRIDDVRYSDPHSELEGTEDEFGLAMSKFAREKTRFLFEYDFGDGWEHEVKGEKILPREAGKRYPICVAGERACPPEDCGGVWGYQDFLEAIRDPKNERREELLEWIGGAFDPEAFNVAKANRNLIRDVKTLASWR